MYICSCECGGYTFFDSTNKYNACVLLLQCNHCRILLQTLVDPILMNNKPVHKLFLHVQEAITTVCVHSDSVDVDECSINTSVCGNNSTCVNDIGSYSCLCDEGYTFYQNVCVGEFSKLLVCT